MRKIWFTLGMLTLLALPGCASMMQSMQTPPPIPTTPDTPVFFQEWSAALDPAALSTIASAAAAANKLPTQRVVVTGAADTIGSAKANQDLSRTRAQVVADQLITDGVAAGRIKLKAVGEVEAPSMAGLPAQFSRRALIHIGG
jgi:outer membrane protein OmpA-like peptidoglycan-associated protein